ncbi:hypothetical protein GPECTOR_1g315 [Gonium pectorale]|uniref:Uncharacterized protein n=1 Tax=Gonium pectorale TaxID=33097 RepID=A0A150H2F8_GONPE|nr:hypothetical protein GPECTOR_1g315 [Gonium pectorale]|eukprot:KXZ56356.1 hypothetical protein GPECTOR_1g315 [Gonium pectorale]
MGPCTTSWLTFRPQSELSLRNGRDRNCAHALTASCARRDGQLASVEIEDMSLQQISRLAAEAILPVLEAAGQHLEYLGILSLDPMASPCTRGLLHGLRALRQRRKRVELGELFVAPLVDPEQEVREVVEIMGPPRRFGIRMPMAWARCGEAVECIIGRLGVQARRAGAPLPQPGSALPAAPQQQQQQQRQAEEAGPRPAHSADEAGDLPQGSAELLQGSAPSTATCALRRSLQHMRDGASGRGYDIGACGASSSAALSCGSPGGGARAGAANGRLQLLLLSGPAAAALTQSPPELERWVYHGDGHELYAGGGLFSWESLRAVQSLPSLGAILVACDMAGARPVEAEAAASLLPLDGGGAPSDGVRVVRLPRGCLPDQLADQPLQLSLELQKQIMCGVLEALQVDWDAQAAGPGGLGGGISREAILWLQAMRRELMRGLPGALWCGTQRAAAAGSAAAGEGASPGSSAVTQSR